MKAKSQRYNWILDAVLLVGFLLSYPLDLTGLAIHEWLGLGVGILAVYHLIVHWQWVKTVTHRLLGRTSAEARWYYAIDVGLAVGFLTILASGLIISTWLELPLPNYLIWRDAHILSSIVTLILTVIKIGFHWQWIVCVAKRSIIKPLVAALMPKPASPAAGVALAGRRDFLKLMGVVGLAALFVSYRAVETVLGDYNGAVAANPLPEPGPGMLMPTAPAPSPAAPSPTASALPPTATLPPTNSPAGVAVPQSIGIAPATASPTALVAPTETIIPTATIPVRVSESVATAAPCVVRCTNGCSYPGKCRKYTDANRNGRCDLGECM